MIIITTGKNEPPTYGEMVLSEGARKNNHLYRAAAMEANNAQIRDILSATAAQLEALSQAKGRITLQDTERVKTQSLLYLRACIDANVTPTFAGLCRSCGYTPQGINHFLRANPTHETSIWLNMVHDAFSEALADAALRGSVQPVFAIFALKSRAGWSEDGSPFDKPQESGAIEISAEEIATKYDMLPD